MTRIFLSTLFVFSVNLSASAQFAFQQTFNDPSVTAFDGFGGAVDISNGYILVGAEGDDTNGSNIGQAHLFDFSGSLLHTFNDPTPTGSDFFGSSVAIDGNYVAIGSDGHDGGAADIGQVHVFDAVSGNLLQTFNDPSSPSAADGFGSAIAVSGNHLLVGAPFDDTNGSLVGQAYLFDVLSGNLLQTFNDPTISGFDDFFGHSVAIDGNNVVIGAIADDSNGSNVGQAHLFDAVTGNLLKTFNDPSVTLADQLGWSVDIEGNNVLVGARYDDTNGTNVGQAHLFDATTGNLIHTFNDPTITTSDEFGFDVSLSGNFALIGARADDSNGNQAGQAHVFDITSGSLVQTVNDPTAGGNQQFGWSVAIYGNNALVGVPGAGGIGEAHLFSVPTIVVDPNSSGATDVLDDLEGSPSLVTNPVPNPFNGTTDLAVGNTGNGELLISDGGVVNVADDLIVAVQAGSTGMVNMTGGQFTVNDTFTLAARDVGNFTLSGGQLHVIGQANIGFHTGSQGTLDINSGTATIDSGMNIGLNPGSNGQVIVNDASLLLTDNAFDVFVGKSGAGELTVDNGALADFNDDLEIGLDASSTGTVTVGGTGANSTLDVRDGIGVGVQGDGTLNVLAGGSVLGGNTNVGQIAGATGVITLNGTAAQVNLGRLNVGGTFVSSGGTGTINISEGGFNVTNEVTLWSGGTINLNGGSLSAHTFDNSNGGSLNHTDGSLGIDGGSYNNGGATLLVESTSGNPSFTLRNGATTSSTFGLIASSNLSKGQVAVEGNGSTWTMTEDLLVANGGDAELRVLDGGAVVSARVRIADNLGSMGKFFLEGNNSNLNTTDLIVGRGGNGQLRVLEGATANVSNHIFVGDMVGSNGELRVDESTLIVSDSAYVGGNDLSAGGTALLFVSFGSVNITNQLKIWSPGTVTINSGLLVADTIDHTNGGTFNLNGGTVAFDVFNGDLTVQGGTVAISTTPDLANVFGNYDQQSGALNINLGGTLIDVEHDVLDVQFDATLSGDLNVFLTNGFVPAAGDSFEIIRAGNLNGTFTNENLPVLPGLLTWDVDYDTTNDLVTLTVLSGQEDLNGDGFVDGLDLGILLSNWNQSTTPDQGELNGTPPVDGLDLGLLLAAWNPPPLAAAAVPEPSALLLVFSALCFGLVRTRRYAASV